MPKAPDKPMTLTLLALKSLNRSLKSELTNIPSLDFEDVNDQFPGGIEPGGRRLRLPECQVK
ncbi:MAG: hypothetical protein ACE5FD_16590 [Anaerolineae bacterium]